MLVVLKVVLYMDVVEAVVLVKQVETGLLPLDQVSVEMLYKLLLLDLLLRVQ